MESKNFPVVILLVLTQFTEPVKSQGPTNNSIAAAVSDAAREVSARRSGGLVQAQRAASGQSGPQGMAAPPAASPVDTPVSIHARFFSRREAPDFVEAVGFAGDLVTTATANFAERNGGALPDSAEFRRQLVPYCPMRSPVCNPNDLYRTANGSCNNLRNPLWGASFTTQARFLPPAYGDEFNLGSIPRRKSITGVPLPSPRDISNALFNTGTSPPRSKRFSIDLTHFGQFIDHDFVSTPILRDDDQDIDCCNGNTPVIRPECFSFSTPPGDFKTTCMPFVRSDFGVEPGCIPGPRNQINQRTSFLDLSVAYGNTLDGQKDLRENGTGRLLEGLNRILPDGPPGTECLNGETCFKSGDNRPAEVPMLTVIHIIFLREHNNIVERLRSLGYSDGEQLYQEAKKILTGVYQHIIYTEYLPVILGDEGMDIFGLRSTPSGFNTQYNPSVNAATRNSFGAAAYRFGHSLVGSLVESYNEDFTPRDKEPMEDHFFSTRLIRNFDDKFGPDAISRWMTTQFKSKSDRFLTPAVRNRLFQTMPKNGFDLSALNIQRGRDHGIPAYNRWRQFCGLHAAQHFGTNYNGLTDHDSLSAKALKSVYRSPDDIDLFAGGLTEKIAPGALVGPTFRCLIGFQFMLFKTGDRFFYENNFYPTRFSAAQLQQIKKQTLSALYCRTMDVNTMPESSFDTPLAGKERKPCNTFPGLDLKPWANIYNSYKGNK
ncbi:peroxidase-like protein [Mytilus galloprovincialis]|uniref:peroxidase-like protein n=1 Tax=Mytilus galloprovincialis TaxID=29158 RepID=UPI003F7CD1F8